MRQPDRAKPAREETPPEKNPGVADRVEISLDARARLAELADGKLKTQGFEAGEAPSQTNRPYDGAGDKIAEIRAKIEAGFYDQPEIRDRIISNLTDELDLE